MSAPDAGQRRQALAASPMIRKLRWQFVAACMGLIAAVLAIVFGCVWASAQNALERSSHMALEQALSRRGGDLLPGFRQNGGDDQVLLPYFTVQVWGTTVYVTGGTYSGLEDTDALTAILTDCLSQEADEGSLPGYALRYLRQDDGLYTQIAFVDISLETAALRQMMASYLRIGLLSLLLLAGASFLLSLRVTRPVERAWRQQRQFLSDASHELRTPVSVIKSACEYGETYGETLEEQRETLAMIHRQADKMSQLIDQLLRITRLDQGTELARRERVDLAALAREVCAEGPWPQDRLTLEGGEPVFAQVDRALIARLLQNLIDNGFKYGKPGGGVWVTLRRQGGEALLTVRDDGIGIAPDQQARVWQRFYQVDPVRGEKSGAGLGLSMVWKIAQAHGGHMSLESVPGQGSSFTLHLPAER